MTAKSQFEQTAANGGPCSRPDCACCAYRTEIERRVDGLADMVNGFLEMLREMLVADTRLLEGNG